MAGQDFVIVQPDSTGKRVDARSLAKGDPGDPSVYRQITELDGPKADRIIELLERILADHVKLRLLAENELGQRIVDSDLDDDS